MLTKRHLVSVFLAFILLAPMFLAPPAPVQAQGWSDFSADIDGDGLPNAVEQDGWYNTSGGPYFTNYLDADTDDDGLTDGLEKLYDTDPLDDHSPGIYVEYQEHFQTRQYYSWQRYGNRYIALPYPLSPWHADVVIVRRGATFHVGGPADGTIEIEKSISGLTTLPVERDHCAGRWEVSVPSWGTVGMYTIRVEDGAWSETLDLYVIFEIPSGLDDSFLDAFLYDGDPTETRDETSIGYYEKTYDHQYDNGDPGFEWIPEGEWINHGYTWTFRDQQFRDFIIRDHVMPAINGVSSQWSAANALVKHTDDVTCFHVGRPLSNAWCVLNPSACDPYNNWNQCTNIANLLVAFCRSSGIPSRPVFVDWVVSSFDHATEAWISSSWYVMRGYNGGEGSCPDPHYTGGYVSLRSPYSFGSYSSGQGVYAAGEDWLWGDVYDGMHSGADEFRQASWSTSRLVKKDWLDTRFRPYKGWSSEPLVTGTPPQDWPALLAPPVVNFTADTTVGPEDLQVHFTDQTSGHVRSWEWDFGDDDTSTQENPNHTYDEDGYYTVSLTVYGGGGEGTETKTNYIHVTKPVEAAFSGTPTSGCEDLEVTFTDESTGDVDSWLWDFGDDHTSTAQNPTHTYTEGGDYTVSLTVFGEGSDSDTETKTNYIHVDPATVADFSATPTSGGAPLDVSFTDLSTGTDVDRWSWNFGDPGSPSNTSTEQNPSHTYENEGTYTVVLTAWGDCDEGGEVTETKTNYIQVTSGGGGGGMGSGAPLLAAPAPSSASGPEEPVAEAEAASPVVSARGPFESTIYLPTIFGEGSIDGGEDDPEPSVPESTVNDPDAVIQFGQVVADYGVDLDGDGRFDELVLEVEADAEQAGDYWIMGALAGELAYALGEVHLAEGSNVVTLHFDGHSIYMSKTDGPYGLANLWATDTDNPGPTEFANNLLGYARTAYQTAEYEFGDFGVTGATLSGDYSYRTVDTDDDGYDDGLVVEAGLYIEKAGAYTVKGALLGNQDEPLGEASWRGSGSQAVLQFDGLRDTTGPYSLYIHVRDDAGQVTDGMPEPYDLGKLNKLSTTSISLGVDTAIPPNPSQIMPTFAVTNTGYSDTPVDTDSDGQFDQLVFTTHVNVEPGEGGQPYRIEGWLMDEDGSLIAWAMGDAQVLNEGIQSLSLAFDGRVIHEHGVDGPYTVAMLRALPGGTYTVLDTVELAYTTPAYDHDDFEDPIVVDTIGDVFEDRMEARPDQIVRESFETGTLGADWTTSSSTGYGRIQLTDSYGTGGGEYALLMDVSSDGVYTLNEAIWTVDLSGEDEASLVFWQAEWDDEEDDFVGDFTGSFNADGIAISDDGVNWHPVFNLPDQPIGVWRQHTVNLAAEAAAAGMTMGSDFRIKFQQYDNYPLDGDGRGWDEIVVIKNDTSDLWTAESPWSLDEQIWYSPSHAWQADAPGSQSGSVTSVSLDVSHHVDSTVRFRTCYEMQPGSVGHLEASSNGVDWTQVATYSGSVHPWATEFVDLSGFDAGAELHLRFNADSQAGLVWYVDDVWIFGWLDDDGDGLSNVAEDDLGTDPDDPDTDNDGLTDGQEVNEHGTLPKDPDSDNDGMLDGWEVEHNLDPLNGGDADDDPDGDGLTNLQEHGLNTDPNDDDSDDDGLADGDEVNTHNTDPSDDDSDDDGLTDGDEVNTYNTDPNDDDSDDDGLTDGDEVNTHNTDPSDDDSDDDGLTDGDEVNTHNTDPNDDDSDDDGMLDGWEVDHGLDPLDDSDADDDPDNDGLTNLQEHGYGSDPHDVDSDDDGMPDGWEASEGFNPADDSDASGDADEDGLTNLGEYENGTDPHDEDSDDDGMLDGWEVDHGLDPLDDSDADDDPDNDGLTNLQEHEHGSDPHDVDSDDDGLDDGDEVNVYGTEPGDADTDDDGLDDGDEVNTYHTDPKDKDSDDDGMEDGWEVDHGLNPLDDGDADDDLDGDGLTNLEEHEHGSDPNDVDSDDDGLEDGDEVNIYGTEPGKADTDDDGMPDGWEVDNGLNPLNDVDGHTDVDGDGLTNLEEYQNDTDPNDSDSDDDRMLDGWEVDHGLDPLDGTDANADPDGDGLTNLEEYQKDTDPHDWDSDDDGIPDGGDPWPNEVTYSTFVPMVSN